MIFPFVCGTGVAQQLCHSFIQGIDSVAAYHLQVKASVARIIQNRGILAAVQQGVCMRERLLLLEGEEILLRYIHSRQIGFHCFFDLSAINHRELHQRNRGVCLLQAAACAAMAHSVDAYKQID